MKKVYIQPIAETVKLNLIVDFLAGSYEQPSTPPDSPDSPDTPDAPDAPDNGMGGSTGSITPGGGGGIIW